MKQEKEKELWGNCDIEKDMSWNMYQILVNTAVSANLIGTICNFCIHGTELPTILCGVCLLMILIIGCAGWITQKVQLPAVVIILILSWFEFPYLYYCYGNTAIVYLILGIVGLAVFFPRSMVIASYAFTLLEYLVIMMISFERPSRWSNMDEIGIIGTTLGSFIIVALSVFTMIFVLLKRYEEQRKQLLTLSENLEFAANHDPLTRLYNRRYLVKQVDGWMRIPGRNFWIILMDVDDFKVVNDTYGHDAGDNFLIELSQFFKGIPMLKDCVYRKGGDEFVAIIHGKGMTRMNITNLSRFIHNRFEKTWLLNKTKVKCDVSIGVACYGEDATTMKELLYISDMAMYQAKRKGPGNTCYGIDVVKNFD